MSSTTISDSGHPGSRAPASTWTSSSPFSTDTLKGPIQTQLGHLHLCSKSPSGSHLTFSESWALTRAPPSEPCCSWARPAPAQAPLHSPFSLGCSFPDVPPSSGFTSSPALSFSVGPSLAPQLTGQLLPILQQHLPQFYRPDLLTACFLAAFSTGKKVPQDHHFVCLVHFCICTRMGPP